MEPLDKYDYLHIDLSDPQSLLSHATKLKGHTFREIIELGIVPEGIERDYGNKRYKGGMGTLIEERYFGYRANNDERPDFSEAGVELKTTCYDVKKNGELRAGERLVLTMIPYNSPIEDSLYDSHMWKKSKKILLIYYRRNKEIPGYDQEISYVALFTPPAKDMAIIEEDYNTIKEYVQNGKADALSESLTHYLGACTKGASEATMWTEQYYPPYKKAKRRAFCLKRNYMDYVLNHYLIGNEGDAESIIKDSESLKEKSFESYVLSLIEPHIGKTDKQLCEELEIPYTGNKAQWTTITYHLLGLKSDRAEEFEKANISVRTVRVEKTGKVKESLSLAPFSFSEIAQEKDWENSALFEYFDVTRFFFIAFQKQEEEIVLRGARFWSMPKKERDGELRKCWLQTKLKAQFGVTLIKQYDKNGEFSRITNDLPKKGENLIAHVRPHTKNAAYRLEDGTEIGDIKRDGDLLPDGQWMTKQSFWLNNDYIAYIVSFIKPIS